MRSTRHLRVRLHAKKGAKQTIVRVLSYKRHTEKAKRPCLSLSCSGLVLCSVVFRLTVDQALCTPARVYGRAALGGRLG